MRAPDNDLENNFENSAWKLEQNVEELQEILNRIMQRIVSIITSALQQIDMEGSVFIWCTVKTFEASVIPIGQVGTILISTN